MLLKVIFPVERLGLCKYNVDPSYSFYQIVKDVIKQYDIDISQYVLVDDVGNQYNMLKPMKQEKFYPGIQVEFRKINEDESSNMIMNPLILDNINITIQMVCIQKEFNTIVNRHTLVETVIQEQYPKLQLNQNFQILYQNKLYNLQNSFDDIGIIEDNKTIQIVYLDEEDLKNLSQNQEISQEDQLTKQEILQLNYEKRLWEQNMGVGQILTIDDKEKLKQQRQQIKQLMKFKLFTVQQNIQFKKQIVSIQAQSNMLQLQKLLIDEVKKQIDIQNDKIKFQLANSNVEIEFGKIPTYDYFNGANTAIKFEIIE